MLTHHRRLVCLSLVSTDLPVWSTLETSATLYQKDVERFHVLLNEPPLPDREPEPEAGAVASQQRLNSRRLLWLEISPYRVIMTMQGNSNLNYRHHWETGVYGTSRYWLHGDSLTRNQPLHMRNYTRSLILEGGPMPDRLQVEYELWSQKVQMGRYILNLEFISTESRN